MKPLVYVFTSCLIGKDEKFSLEKVQMLKTLSTKFQPVIFWVGKKEQSDLNLLLDQMKLKVSMIPPLARPDEEDTLAVRRKYLNRCLKGVNQYFVVSELKSVDKRFLFTRELTQEICNHIMEDHSNQNKVFIRSKDVRKMGGKQTVKSVIKRFTPKYIDKDSSLLAVPINLPNDEEESC